MNKTISLRLDEDVKKSAQEVAESAGLTLSALINSYLRQIAYTRHIDLYAPEPMTPKMEKIIEGIETEIKAGDISEPFDNIEDFLADLKK